MYTETLRSLKRFRNTKIEHRPDGVDVILHRTAVVSTNGGTFTLRTGGWATPTTKTRIKQACDALGIPLSLWQERGVWYIATRAGTWAWNGRPVTFDRETLEPIGVDILHLSTAA